MLAFVRAGALLFALLAAGPAFAQAPAAPQPAVPLSADPDTDDDAPPGERSQADRERAREERRAHTEMLREAAKRIVWQAPDELKEILEKYITLPEQPAGDARTDTLRGFLREVNRRVPEIAAAEGYFSAKVETRVEGEGAQRHLLVVVTPGTRTTIEKVIVEFEGDVALEGDGREEQREATRISWTLPPGRFFRQNDWDDAKSRIIERLSDLHYAAARMADSVALVDATEAKATLKVIIESGPRFTTGPIVIEGLQRYPAELVLRYNRMKAGDPFRLERIVEFQRFLQNAPWFASVVVDVERDPASPSSVPVKVSIVERAPIDVGVSIGYGTDTGARGEISFRHRNAFNKAFDMQSAIAVDKTRQTGYADFFLPPLTFGGPFGDELTTRDSFGVLGEHRSNQGLDTRRMAVAAYRQFKFLRPVDDYRVGLTYQFERKSPEGGDQSIARALAPVAEATWRWVDDMLDPRKGGVLKVRLAAGARSVLSSQDFVQAYAQYQHWFPPGANDQLILRGEIGQTFAFTRDNIPEDFLFRAGGSRSNRGYAYESLGTREGDAIVGGLYLTTGTVEYVHWFSKQWGGAAFFDGGDAGDGRGELALNPSLGVGARWRTPAGPLALDLAYAEREKKWRLSFSVSIAF